MSKKKFDIILESGRPERQYWADLWRYHELFYVLAWRDILVQYKQTVIGILWAVLRPILTVIIFTVIFGKIADLPSEGMPYPIFVLAAMLPWTFFSTAFSNAGNSLVNNFALIGKIYFPRMIIPAASIIVAVVDLLISFVLLIILMFWYNFSPTWHILTLPLFLLIGFFAAFGSGLFIAALNVRYRDFRIIIPFIIQLGLFASPVAFSTTLIPEKYQIFYYLNPMVAVIDGFRWAVSGGRTALNMTEIYISIAIVVFLCILGVMYFRKTEKTFADLI
jgi:lipopolysaccharide transport system permease protein